MITCPSCKKKIPNNSEYCPLCAAKIPQKSILSNVKITDVIGFIGWATMILGFIAALIVGNELAYYDFNWPIFLGIFSGSIVTGILFLAIKKHLLNQERTIELLEKIAKK